LELITVTNDPLTPEQEGYADAQRDLEAYEAGYTQRFEQGKEEFLVAFHRRQQQRPKERFDPDQLIQDLMR
jgi:hypothetical protein